MTVSVAPVPDPPRFTTIPPQPAVGGRVYRYQVAAADPDQGDLPQITARALPPWLALTGGSDGTALLSGTPRLTDVGAQASQDAARVMVGHRPENLAVMQHLALNLLKKELSKQSIRVKRQKAGWDEEFLAKLVVG